MSVDVGFGRGFRCGIRLDYRCDSMYEFRCGYRREFRGEFGAQRAWVLVRTGRYGWMNGGESGNSWNSGGGHEIIAARGWETRHWAKGRRRIGVGILSGTIVMPVERLPPIHVFRYSESSATSNMSEIHVHSIPLLLAHRINCANPLVGGKLGVQSTPRETRRRSRQLSDSWQFHGASCERLANSAAPLATTNSGSCPFEPKIGSSSQITLLDGRVDLGSHVRRPARRRGTSRYALLRHGGPASRLACEFGAAALAPWSGCGPNRMRRKGDVVSCWVQRPSQ